MKIKALVSFAGIVTMGVGEVKDVPTEIANDLIQAKYAEKVNTSSKKSGENNEN